MLENVAHSILAREGTTIPISRRGLLGVLEPDGLTAFDAGDIDSGMITQIMRSLDVESLIIATIKPGTGPPVPLYFAIGPLVLSPLLGVSLLMGSLTGLWSVAALTLLLYVVAMVRHRYAVAHGTEEHRLDQEEAARADQERLEKLAKNLKK